MIRPVMSLIFLLFTMAAAHSQESAAGNEPTLGVYWMVGCEAASASAPVRLEGSQKEFCMERTPVVHQGEIVSATVDDANLVRFVLQDEAARRLRTQTSERVGQRIGIVISGKLLQAPVVQAEVDQIAIGGMAPQAAIATADTFARAPARPSPVILEPGRGIQIYRLGGMTSPPEPIRREEPEYTAAARTAGIQGTVLLMVTIGENGTVSDAKVVRGIDPGLDSKALECVRKWTFRPSMKDGKPVSSAANIEMNFRL